MTHAASASSSSRAATASTTSPRPCRAWARTPSLLWHAATDVRVSTPWSSPGGFAHGDYLRAGRPRPLRPGHGARWPIRRRRRRRSSGSATGSRSSPRPASCRGRCRRTCTCASCALPAALRVDSDPVGADRRVAPRDGARAADQPLRRPLRLRRRHPGRAGRRRAGRAALRRQPQRLDRRHRRHLQPRPATWSASCRTPSAPPTRSSGAPTARCCCGPSCDGGLAAA